MSGPSVYPLPGGSLLVPVEEEQPAGGCACGLREVTPDDPEHARWAAELARRDAAAGRAASAPSRAA